MSLLRFNDGVDVDTSGEYRTLKRRDGGYVVGLGCLSPCADEEVGFRQWQRVERTACIDLRVVAGDMKRPDYTCENAGNDDNDGTSRG